MTAPDASQAAAVIGVQFTGEARINTFVHGTDPETAANLRELLAIAKQGGIFRAAEQNAISEAAVRAVVEKAGGIGIAGEHLIDWLEAWIDEVLTERALHQHGTNEGPAFAAARSEAQRHFDAGRLDEASQAFIDALESDESAERERQEQRTHARLQLLEEAIEWDKLALNGPAAAGKLRRIAALLHPNDSNAQSKFISDRADKYYEQGQTWGDNAALLVAIAAYRAALEEHTCEKAPLEWAQMQNSLGNALVTLGKRDRGTARLEQAEDVYRAALEEFSYEQAPLEWAMVQNNLGITLAELGKRKREPALLHKAAEAYRAALHVRTREQVPLKWAETQHNMGTVLATLAAGETGTTLLLQAGAAFRAALQELTRERVPLRWAEAQHNLGSSLGSLGEREGGTLRLREAVCALSAALEVRTRESVPLHWAETQEAFAIALARLGEREEGTARLKEALIAFRAALGEQTRDRTPLNWARTKQNQGNTLLILGQHDAGTVHLKQAAAAFCAAMKERTRDQAPDLWRVTQCGLKMALIKIGQRQGRSITSEDLELTVRTVVEKRERRRHRMS